jgi:hypothetical protein
VENILALIWLVILNLLPEGSEFCHILRMNEERVPQKVFDYEIKKLPKRKTKIKMGTTG